MSENSAERVMRLERAARVIRARAAEQEHPWATTFALALADALAPAANDNHAEAGRSQRP